VIVERKLMNKQSGNDLDKTRPYNPPKVQPNQKPPSTVPNTQAPAKKD
jgi:hypothetical protein